MSVAETAMGKAEETELLDEIENSLLLALTRLATGPEIENRVRSLAKHRPLIDRRHKSRSPIARTIHDLRTIILHNHKRWEILILSTKPITYPRTHTRIAGLLVAGIHERDGRIVINRLGMKTLDQANIVSDTLDVWQ